MCKKSRDNRGKDWSAMVSIGAVLLLFWGWMSLSTFLRSYHDAQRYYHIASRQALQWLTLKASRS